jgi:hypothetical protein
MNQYLKTTVSQIASLLVAGKYDELATLTHSVRLNAKDIATAVADYGRTLIAIPDEGFETIDIVEIAKMSSPWRWQNGDERKLCFVPPRGKAVL